MNQPIEITFGSNEGMRRIARFFLSLNFCCVLALVLLAGFGVSWASFKGDISIDHQPDAPGTIYAFVIFCLISVISVRSLIFLVALIFYYIEQYLISAIVSLALVALLIVQLAPPVFSFFHQHAPSIAAAPPAMHINTGEKSQAAPSPGLLIPGDNTIPADFEGGNRRDRYTKFSYETFVQTGEINAGNTWPTLLIKENFKVAYLPPVEAGRPVIEKFTFQNQPGDIFYKQGVTDDLSHYILHWNDNGTDLIIELTDVAKGKHNLQSVIDMLGTLQRVPGDSVKAELTPPTGVLAPTAASVPNGFQLFWQELGANSYTIEYRDGPRIIVFSESMDKTGDQSYDSLVDGIEDLDATAKWPRPEGADKPYLVVTHETAPSSSQTVQTPIKPLVKNFTYAGSPGRISISRMKAGGSVIHVIWNDNDSAVLIALYNFSSAITSQSVINLLDTLQRVQ